MKKILLLFLFSIITVVLQQSLFSNIPILGVNFDLVLVYIVTLSIVCNSVESVTVALFTGIIRDSFFPGIFGLNTIVYLILAYLIGYLQKKIYKDSILIPITFTFAATYIKGIIYLFFFFILSYHFSIKSYLLDIILLEAVFNAVFCILIYKLVDKLTSIGLLNREWRF